MRRLLPLVVLLALGLSGCPDPDAGKIFADIQYATRCDVTLGCDRTKERDICGINQGTPCNMGEPEVIASCSVTESGGNRTVTFTASQGSDFSIRVSGATIPEAGGSASGGCQVRVVDGPNTYTGACGSSDPSEAQPCRLNAVMFYEDEAGAAVVEGALFCQGLENQSNPALSIEVTAWGSGPTAMSTPARFILKNCDGLTLE